MKKIPKEFLLALSLFITFLITTFVSRFIISSQMASFLNLFSLYASLFLTLSILAGPLSYLTLWLFHIGGSFMLFSHGIFAFIGAKGLLYFWSRKDVSTWLRIFGITLWVGGGIFYVAIIMIWYSHI